MVSTFRLDGLLRDCRRRGVRDPMLVFGDGAMGLWRAPAVVFPQARHQRCWVRKTRNVSNALSESARPGAKKALQEICNAEDRAHAERAVTAFEETYGAKFPEAVKKITGEGDELPAFYGRQRSEAAAIPSRWCAGRLRGGT